MSRKVQSKLQERAGQRKIGVMQRRKPDQRVRRTHQRLGSALVALIQEKSMDDVTVQEVLGRASVGRSTFYLHFHDKNDLLLSQLENFLEMMSTALSSRKEASHRVVPVARCLHTSATRRGSIARWLTVAVSTTSSICARLLCSRHRAAVGGIRSSPEMSAA